MYSCFCLPPRSTPQNLRIRCLPPPAANSPKTRPSQNLLEPQPNKAVSSDSTRPFIQLIHSIMFLQSHYCSYIRIQSLHLTIAENRRSPLSSTSDPFYNISVIAALQMIHCRCLFLVQLLTHGIHLQLEFHDVSVFTIRFSFSV